MLLAFGYRHDRLIYRSSHPLQESRVFTPIISQIQESGINRDIVLGTLPFASDPVVWVYFRVLELSVEAEVNRRRHLKAYLYIAGLVE